MRHLRRQAFSRAALARRQLLGLLIVLSSCSYQPSRVAGMAGSPSFGAHGLDLTARDPTTPAGEDFWQHANGRWSDGTPVPADQDAVGISPQIQARIEDQLHALLEGAAIANTRRSATLTLLGDFYASWMDEAGIEARGLASAQPYLERIDAAATAADLLNLTVSPGFAAPLAIEVIDDPQDPTRRSVLVHQGSLEMSRDDYLNADESAVRLRAGLLTYATDLLEAAGLQNASSRARDVVSLETQIAEGQMTLAQTREGSRTGRPVDGMARLDKGLSITWPRLLTAAGVDPASSLRVADEPAIADLISVLRSSSLNVWKDYLKFRFLSEHADALPEAFAGARHRFHSTLISGIKERAPRWRSGVRLVNREFEDAVGEAYAKEHVSRRSQAAVREIFDDVREAFRAGIKRADWMDEFTRRGALAKVGTLKADIGGVGPSADYAQLRIDRRDLLGNLLRREEQRRREMAQSLRVTGSATGYPMRPQVFNGFYLASTNTIILNAALLQAPLFNEHADPAVNYGAIGQFIGHEMGHAFDDAGSRVDAWGREVNWWSEAARAAFELRTSTLRDQYAAFEVLPNVKVNGALTLSENIADLEGLQMALGAYRLYQSRHGQARNIEGLSGEQRFFLSNAQMRRTKYSEAALRWLAGAEIHAPVRFRVNGVVRNMDAWYRAFDVRAGAALYLPPEKRVRIF